MTDAQHQELLRKLERLLDPKEPEKIIIFNRDEERVLRSMIQRERAFQAVGMLAGNLRGIVGWIIFMIGTWLALKAGFLQWLTNNL